MARILIVDDEPAIVMAVKDELEFEGHEVERAPDGLSALEKAHTFRPDVMLLDLMLPAMNGFEVCRRLRAEMPDLWIIILTVREHEVDRVRGLEHGADDYVTKPFSLREVVARIKVGLRRRRTGSAGSVVVTFGDVEVDLRAHRAIKRGQEVELTATEFGILELLLRRPGEVIRRDEFLDALWADVEVVPRVIDTHMASLRKKLEDDPNRPVHLHSVRGVGYRLDVTPTQS